MELISRADAIKDAESWVAVDEHERRLQKNVIEWLKEFPPAEPGTNLAEVGTDCISRQNAIDALRKMQTYKMFSGDDMLLIDQAGAQTELMLLPPIQPVNNSENPNSSDTISRQKAKNAICNACGKIDCDEMDTCKKLDIPSEESKALGWQYRTYMPHNKYCPKCGKDSPYNKLWDFCPNCGNDMREVTT